jgi:hypothetical protein
MAWKSSELHAKRRRKRAQRDRRLEKLVIDVLTALGERDATIAHPNGQAMAEVWGTDPKSFEQAFCGKAPRPDQRSTVTWSSCSRCASTRVERSAEPPS